MKIIKFLFSLLLTIGAVYLLNQPWTLKEPLPDDPSKFKETVIPPVGPFVSPFSGFWQNAESLSDYVPQKLEVPEMKGKVKILFDERMVPHIFADDLKDAAFAQGYVTAKFRLWQMDMVSRVSGGRLAEVLGNDLLENDKLQRRRGMVVGAEKAVQAWQQNKETYALIEAYSEGVNTYIRQLKPKDYPLEFKLLNYKPELWSPLKTALVKKYMDMTLCLGEDDLEASNAFKILGPELFNKIYPEYNPKQSPVIPAGTTWNFKPAAKPATTAPVQEAIGLLDYDVYPKERGLVGSNNWAVAGSKTLSGKPILCNDPHLRLSLPSIWFEGQIKTKTANFYGVSVPGIPGVLIGFNENTAWGETNVSHDVLDWYQITWTDAAKTSYQYDGGVKPARIVVDSFAVRGQPVKALDTVRWTEWGPVVYTGKNDDWHDLAMRWIGHDAPNDNDLGTFLGLNTGKNYDDYNQALADYAFPAQNFAFAAQNGDIALTVNGKLPVKKKSQGRFVQDGGHSGNKWTGWIPFEQLPRSKNPNRGFVASANQHSTDPSYPYYYNSMAFDHFRGRFLNAQLSKMDSITPQDMMALQNSNFSLEAVEGMAAMLAQLDTAQLSAVQTQVLKKLRAWDFHFTKDKVEPVLYRTWLEKCYEGTFDEVLVWKDSLPVLMPENWRLFELLERTPSDAIFDNKKTPDKETAKQVVTAAFKTMIEELGPKLADPTFTWANHKKTSIQHLARIPAFSKNDLDIGGYKQALNAISEYNGPSWRMVVELGDEVKAWGVFPGGQSGNPSSPFYTTDLDKWTKGEYNELFFMKDETDNRKPTIYSIEIN